MATAWDDFGSILHASTKIGSYLACMHAWFYLCMVYIGPIAIELRTTNYLAIYSYGYMIYCCMIIHEVEFRLIAIFDQSARHHISKLYRTLHMQLYARMHSMHAMHVHIVGMLCN